jgi:predicted Zn-dependent protease
MDATRRAAPMKSVSIMWAEGVTEAEATTVVSTVRDLLRVIYEVALKSGVALGPTAIRPFGTWVIPAIKQGDPYWGTHWYIDTAYDRGLGQVMGPRFLELVKQEPWQRMRPHFDVAVLDGDLTDEPSKRIGADFVLASTLPGTGTVISVHRLREVEAEEQRLAALKRLVIHNFGHVLEVPSADRTEAVESSAGERHCTNLCVMRHASGVADLLARHAEEQAAGVLFCPACRRDILHSVLKQRISRN